MKEKGLDSCFLHYGIKKEDMEIIEQTCADNGIDAEWMKEQILKKYQEEKSNQNIVDDKTLARIMKKALKNL